MAQGWNAELKIHSSTHPILVCDDETAIRKLFCAALKAAGYQTAEASSGPEAIDLIDNNSYSAVLMDNQMPGASGLEVIAHLRQQPETATLPVILITGNSDVAERVEGLQIGASDFLAKPVDIEELVARVRAQLRGQAAWMHKVEGHLRERAAITRALAQIKPADTVEATAAVVCHELSQLHQLHGVAMFAFGEGDIVMPIARDGGPMLGERVGEVLEAAPGRYLLRKAAFGPWTERSENLRFVLNIDEAAGSATFAFAPMIADGQVLGLLCLATEANDSVTNNFVTHALSAAIDFASVAAGILAPTLAERGRDRARNGLLDHIVANHEFFPVFQPIVDLERRINVGYETLTRFHDGTRPDLRFIEATMLGRGNELELATLTVALDAAQSLPDQAFVSVNVSPALVLSENDRLASMFNNSNREVVLELTEHERVDDYIELRSALDALGPNTKLSVDDAGSGFASLRHVLSLKPHFVKLDLSLVRDIHTDPARQALVSGLEYFATETQARLIAEGIECNEEMETLERLDVELGQGYLLGRPAPLEPISV